MKTFVLSLAVSAAVPFSSLAQSNPHAGFPPEQGPPGFPQTNAEFARQALAIATPGRNLDAVQGELEGIGFVCTRLGEASIVCGPPGLAMHGCQRSIALAFSGQGLSAIRLDLVSPQGYNSDGDLCGR